MIEHFSLLKTERDVQGISFDPLGYLKQYLHTILNTSYMYTFSAFNILFTVIALGVVYVMENFFPEVKNFVGFIYLLDTITFLPGFVYMNFLNQVLNGYTESIRNYLDYLQTVERIAMTCPSKSLEYVYPVLLVLVDLGKQFRGDHLPEYFEFMSQSDPTHKITEKIKGKNFSDSIRYVISMLRHADVGVDELFGKIQQLESGYLVREPKFMHNQNMILLFAWYCVWVPITLWVQVGSTVTFLLFPLISYILWGTAIQRVWLGDAWDDSRPFKESDHVHWPEDFKKSIERICRSRHSLGKSDQESA